MTVLRAARAVVTALLALPALVLVGLADDIDGAWEPFFDETYG